MGKSILFFADGTWQGADSGNRSNVLALFQALAGENTLGGARDDEQEKLFPGSAETPPYVAKYIHGVGDGGNWWSNLVGGAFGAGLIFRVLRGYTFISRQYQPGDRIYLIGFSRGAYTVRALGGLIARMGLLDWAGLGLENVANNALGQRYASAAWHNYMVLRKAEEPPADLFGALQMMIAEGDQQARDARELTPRFIPDVTIDTIAVWDTVGAMGIPKPILMSKARHDYLKFIDNKLSDKVRHGLHAVAIDERRRDFTPTLWAPRDGVVQCLFAGAHADVGGGYPDQGDNAALSTIALHWMAAQLGLDDGTRPGLRFTLNALSDRAHLGPSHRPWDLPAYWLRKKNDRELPCKDPVMDCSHLPYADAVKMRLGQQVIVISDGWFGRRTITYQPAPLTAGGYFNAAP
ncbi:DUF2235 domain-containing protein [Novosphingobium sp. SG707]|uniref:DUF2235 domain-containing protein n=1 Tax=Novosphingobium sp. SG707 TaxID=2586996 RepID=UPI00144712E2|nr:DUF2235 domain-containing protein [Novosphingobium sp. SG707]NKJ00715.1 glutathione S-transferase [Novosphingobium sp. SG707]